jgi:hypothetical protein
MGCWIFGLVVVGVVVASWVLVVLWLGEAGDSTVAHWAAYSILVGNMVWVGLEGWLLFRLSDGVWGMIGALLAVPWSLLAGLIGAFVCLWLSAPIVSRQPQNEQAFWRRFSVVAGAVGGGLALLLYISVYTLSLEK